MSTDDRLRSRVVRRELHSPRSGAAVVLAVLAAIALAWLGTESVLAALDRPALLMTPADMAAGIRGLPSVQAGLLVAAGAVLVVVGAVLVVTALAPGRRGRRTIGAGRTAAVVDDRVVGSALVRVASRTAGLSPDRVVARVGRRSAEVRITPISGVRIDRDAVREAVQQAADGFGLDPAVRAAVRIDRKGKVGG